VRARDVATKIDAGLAWHVLSEDFDLLAEFLIDAVCTGTHAGPYAVLGWTLLMAVWQELGFVPGPTFDPVRYRSLSGDGKNAYAFEHVYHTNFVAGMLCAVAITAAPPRLPLPEAAGHDDELERLLGYAGALRSAHEPTIDPTWLRVVSNVRLDDRALLHVLVDAVMIKAARARHWTILTAVLNAATRLGFHRTVTFREARDLHARCARYGK
jgi:hypothetical protein